MKAFCQFLIIVSLIILAFDLSAQSLEQNGSPYFLLQDQSQAEQFPLLSNEVHATITGPIADVQVVQTYKNDGNQAIEAIYVFPSSTRSAVYAMKMKIGDRIIVAQIQEKAKARETYETAKKEGKRTSLLEQHMPNVFQMNVANILPGETVEIEMNYTEFIIPQNQTYQWVYPMVVGPRYTGEKSTSFTNQPYQRKNESPSYSSDIHVSLNMSMPLQKIDTKTHRVNIRHPRPNQATISLDKSAIYKGDRDFVLDYSLSGNRISTGVQAVTVGGENYFLCQIEPPTMSSKPIISPREYIFILDVSGSMRGEPLDISKQLMKNLFSGLNPTDKFNVLLFSGASHMMFPYSQTASAQNLRVAMDNFNKNDGGGGTNMLSAIHKALAVPKEDGYSRSFVIVTDGYVSVDEEVFQTIKDNLGQANFFSFGIGSSVNRNIIEGIAHVGRGEPYVITEFKYAKDIADRLKRYIESPMLTDVTIEGKNIELYDVVPESVPDLMGERPIYFFGKYNTTGEASLQVNGNQGCNSFSVSLPLPDNMERNEALAYLWAREKIRLLDDFNGIQHNNKRVEEITALGLKHNLLTKYTSFVAVDKQIAVNDPQNTTKVKQPLPMPHNVENSAIGMEMNIPPMISNGKSYNKVDIQLEGLTNVEEQIVETIIEAYLEELSPEALRLLLLHDFSLGFRQKNMSTDASYSTDQLALLIFIDQKLQEFGIDLGSKTILINFKKV